MTRLVHISDLHFGRADASLTAPLLAAVKAAAPDLTVISGDFTQRAREHQFREARAFVDALPGPFLAVPGNHDMPLHRPLRRVLDPFRTYRRYISSELEPIWRGEDAVVAGINTAFRWDWQRGRMGRGAQRRVCELFSQGGHGRAAPVRVLVAHHPFEQKPGDAKAPMRRGIAGAAALADCGADVILTGHLHSWGAAPMRAGGMLQVQAGTSLSTRLRGEENDFNVLDLSPERIVVTRLAAAGGRFAEVSTHAFAPGEVGWRPADDD